VLAGDVKDVVLLDVTPLSLGIETLGGVTEVLVERNTTIPSRKSKVFTTASDNQTQVEIHVLQGERQFARDNRTLARFHLEGLPPAPRGIPQIEVAFDIDANGIVNVSAKDLGTGREQRITVTASTQLSREEIDRMVREAELKAEEDRAARELVDLKNQAESMVYATEKAVADLGDKVSESDKREAEEKIKAMREALNSEDKEVLERALSELTAVSHRLAAQVYQAASAAGASDGDTVIDQPPPDPTQAAGEDAGSD